MIDPPPWGECLPRTPAHGYPNTATLPQRMSAIAMTSDLLTNPDRDNDHRRRRDMGDTDEDPDGRAVARKLYGGRTDSESTDDTNAAQ